MYTVTAPKNSWLGQSSVETLGEAIQRRAAWNLNQNAHAIIINPDGYIVSTNEQNMFLAGYTTKAMQ